MSTYAAISNRIKHLLHADSDGQAKFDEMIRHRSWDVIVPGDTSDGAENNHYLLQAQNALGNLEVTIVSADDVTENDTDYATLEINSATGTTATLTSMMTAVTTKDTGGIDINQGVAVDFTLTTLTLAEGSWLVLEVTKSGAGKALPPMTVHIEGDFV